MKCPHCEQDFPLTWKLYFQTPMPWGRHTCPHCGQAARFRPEIAPTLWGLLVGSLGMAPYLWLLRNTLWDQAHLREWITLGAAAATGIFLGILTDNYVKSRVRTLEK